MTHMHVRSEISFLLDPKRNEHFVKGCMHAWNWNLKWEFDSQKERLGSISSRLYLGLWVDELWVESTLPSALGVLLDKDHI